MLAVLTLGAINLGVGVRWQRIVREEESAIGEIARECGSVVTKAVSDLDAAENPFPPAWFARVTRRGQIIYAANVSVRSSARSRQTRSSRAVRGRVGAFSEYHGESYVLPKESLCILARLRHLETLHASHYRDLTMRDLVRAGRHPFLRELSLDATGFTEAEDYEWFRAYPQLEKLRITMDSKRAKLAQLWQCVPSLRELRLYGDGVSDASLEGISALPKLAYLWAAGDALTNTALTHLASSQIENLQFFGRLTDSPEIGKCLSRMPNLQRLSLHYSKIGDDSLSGLTSGSLTYLDVSGTKITPQILDKWADNCPRLRYISGRKTALSRRDREAYSPRFVIDTY